jgi:hypothetical protein
LRESLGIPFWFLQLVAITLLLERSENNEIQNLKDEKDIKKENKITKKGINNMSQSNIRSEKEAYIQREDFLYQNKNYSLYEYLRVVSLYSILFLSTLCFFLSWQFSQFIILIGM